MRRLANDDKNDANFDSSLHFRIMGHGREKHGVTGLTVVQYTTFLGTSLNKG